jgi:formylmethanofuran dehydrogenase subunit B
LTRTTDDVACTACGCVCDDLSVTADGGRLLQTVRACPLAEAWYARVAAPPAAPRAAIRGRPVLLAEAVEHAAAVLAAARRPLVYGLSRSSTDGQREAVALADRLGAVIDTTASQGHAPALVALQDVGESTCTLGEVKQRADLVVFWGSDPVESHPRHLERYSRPAGGGRLGGVNRRLVTVDVRYTRTAELSDVYVPVRPGGDFEALWTLRALVRGEPLTPGADTGADIKALTDLASRMKAARFGIVFFGLGLSRAGHRTVEALLSLVTELNDHTRFYARRMRVSGDVAGADSVLAWQTGYPFGVDLSRGYPRYNPGEYTAQAILERGEPDACLLVGSHGLRRLSLAALDRLAALPVVALDPPGSDTPFVPEVRFTTGVPGVHRAGTAYRMDEVPIPLRQVVESDLPGDADVLRAVAARLVNRPPRC